jgi:hypothetical protein
MTLGTPDHVSKASTWPRRKFSMRALRKKRRKIFRQPELPAAKVFICRCNFDEASIWLRIVSGILEIARWSYTLASATFYFPKATLVVLAFTALILDQLVYGFSLIIFILSVYFAALVLVIASALFIKYLSVNGGQDRYRMRRRVNSAGPIEEAVLDPDDIAFVQKIAKQDEFIRKLSESVGGADGLARILSVVATGPALGC